VGMMREIEYKIWDKENKKWVRGFDQIVIGDEKDFYSEWINMHSGDVFIISNVVIPFVEIVMFTGLLDKNGKKIFECDIVKTEGIYSGESCNWTVSFHNTCFKLTNKDDMEYLSSYMNDELEIIGNIFENPELVKDYSCK
jgi:uncharacterized phage protein (TIGR01671 family)